MIDAHVIIVGYGVPGRLLAELLKSKGITYSIIERNAETVSRCANIGLQIFAGDVRDPELLKQAGIENAKMLCLTLPDDPTTLEAVSLARKMNPSIQIIARAAFTSGGMEATKRGANEVIVAEQVVAMEFTRVIEKRLKRL